MNRLLLLLLKFRHSWSPLDAEGIQAPRKMFSIKRKGEEKTLDITFEQRGHQSGVFPAGYFVMSLTASVCLLISEWIFFLLMAVTPRSRRTFAELLIGCLLNLEGWVTRAIGAIWREAHWTT